MHLLNVETLVLHDFQGSAIPKYEYAILSHTWGDDEVNFQDFQAGRGPFKKGYEKIAFTCEQARRDGLKWAWVDTCCIDKSSSAELSEAVNSMYLWYHESAICYAYLVDVDEFPHIRSTDDKEEIEVPRWFTRSWTLQELIAPRRLHFYGRGWKDIGLCDESKARVVSKITRIPVLLIEGYKSLSEYCVAQKMSWAAHRSSTRPEDIAYSLLGLFNISMPLLYGEGQRAFVRLQEEILKETDDHSLLCWTVPETSPRAWTLQSVFAASPDDFSEAGGIMGNLFDSGHPSAVTNRGLQIHLPLTQRRYSEGSHLYHRNAACLVFDAALNAGECEPSRPTIENQMSIQLVRTPQISDRHLLSNNRFARLATPSLNRISIDPRGKGMVRAVMTRATPIYIHKSLFDWERDRFGVGGVHFQDISVVESLSPISTTSHDRGAGGVNLSRFQIETVLYPGLEEELRNVTITGVPPSLNVGIKWSPIYGCIIFDSAVRRIPRFPLFVLFGVKFLYASGGPYSILLAWDEDYIHFSLRPSQVQMSKLLSFKELLKTTRESEHMRREVKEAWAKLIDPSDASTHKGNCWEMYGKIASTRVVAGERDIELTLVREDPNSKDGEAAGDRLHFLVQGTDHKPYGRSIGK